MHEHAGSIAVAIGYAAADELERLIMDLDERTLDVERLSAEGAIMRQALEDIVDDYKTPMNRDAVKAFGLVKFKARQALEAVSDRQEP